MAPEQFRKLEDCTLKYPNSVDEKCNQEWEGLNLYIFKFWIVISFVPTYLISLIWLLFVWIDFESFERNDGRRSSKFTLLSWTLCFISLKERLFRSFQSLPSSSHVLHCLLMLCLYLEWKICYFRTISIFYRNYSLITHVCSFFVLMQNNWKITWTHSVNTETTIHWQKMLGFNSLLVQYLLSFGKNTKVWHR